MNDTAARGKAAPTNLAAPGATFDAVVIGGDVDGLVAATKLANAGSRVLLVEEGPQLGGLLREIEFAPGLRAAPLAPPRDAGVLALGDGAPVHLQLSADPASVARTVESLRGASATDAARWGGFIRRVQASAGFLAEMYRAPPPRIDADSAGEFLTLAGLARKYRKLGRHGMGDLLRMLPIPVADLLDDEFETAVLKGALAALAVSDLAQGPAAAGTGFTFLHRQVVLSRALQEGGSDFVAEHERRARAAGVMVRTDTKVTEIRVRDGRATGVVLGGGEEIACDTVISSLDPYRSLVELIDPKHHDPEFIHAVRNVRFRGVATKVLLAFDEPPALPGVNSRGGFAGSIVIAPTIRYVERAYEATKYGRCSDEPFIEVRFPSPRVGLLHVQYTPYSLRDGRIADAAALAERAVAAVDQRLPGFGARVRASKVLGPRDLEAEFGLRDGAVSRGEMTLDQVLFMRPVPDASRYATPIEGYFICGAGTHPGAGIHGISGELAAKASRVGRASPRVASGR